MIKTIQHGSKEGHFVVTFEVDGVSQGPTTISADSVTNETGRALIEQAVKMATDGEEIAPAQDKTALISEAESVAANAFQAREVLRQERIEAKIQTLSDAIKKISPDAADEDVLSLATLITG